MGKLATVVLLVASLGLPVAALEGEATHRIAGHEAGWFFVGADKPTLVLWHQFDQQMWLGIPPGRDSWHDLLSANRGDRFKGSYNVLALNHPWRDAEAASSFSEGRLRVFVSKIHNFLRRRGVSGDIYTMGASAGATLAILHCDMAPRVCQGAVAIGGYHRFRRVDAAGLVLDGCYGDKGLLVLNSQSEGRAALREHIRGHKCDNIGSFVLQDSRLHGMAWLRDEPDDGGVWRRVFAFFGI